MVNATILTSRSINCHFIIPQETTDYVLRQVYDTFIASKRSNLPAGSKSGLSKVCQNSKYAFVTSCLVATYMQNSLSCSIKPLPEAFTKEYLSLATKKNSPYLGVINHKYEFRVDLQFSRLGPLICVIFLFVRNKIGKSYTQFPHSFFAERKW